MHATINCVAFEAKLLILLFTYQGGPNCSCPTSSFGCIFLFKNLFRCHVNRPFADEVINFNIILGWMNLMEMCFFIVSHLRNSFPNMQFRVARKASKKVGAQIVLGDRPIEITVCSS